MSTSTPRVEVIDVGLPSLGQPFSWATRAGGLMFTAHGPVTEEGRVDVGPIEQQTRLTLQNLQRAVEAAGATLKDVAQVMIYMCNAEDMKTIDSVYREFFTEPWPNRSSVVVKALVVPGMLIELVAYVALA